MKKKKKTGHDDSADLRKRAEETLRYQAVPLANTYDAIIASDEHYRLTAWNAAAESLYGWKAEEVLGRFGLDVTQTEFPGVEKSEMLRTIAEIGLWRGEVTQARKDGTRIPVEVASIVLHDESGRITGYLSVNRDITERKRAEEKIKDLAKFPSENPFPVLRLDKDGVILYANEASDGLLQHWGCVVGSYAPTFWLDLVAEALSSQSRRTIDIKFGEQTYSFDAVPILDAGYVNLYGSKITERKRAEDVVRGSEEKYMGLTENINLGIYRNTVGPEGKFIEANPAIIGMFGYKNKEEFLAINFSDLYQNPEDRNKFNDKMLKEGFVRGEELWLKKKDGSFFVGSVSAVAVKDKQGHVKYYDGIIDNITERKRVEEALRKSEERYRTLIEDVGEGIGFVNPEEQFAFANAAAEDIFGVPPSGLLGRGLREFARPEQFGMIREQTDRRRAGEKSVYEIEISRPNGEKRNLLITAVPQFDGQGQFVGTFGVFRDITERERAEEEIRQKAKELQEKNDELTRFTYAVSHDLKSPLVTIRTFQGHLEQDLRSQDAARIEMDLGYIRNAADKMSCLLDELLRLSRVGRMMNPSEEAPLQEIVKEALDLVAGRITGRGVRVDLTEEPVVLAGDRTRLVEVFQNLVDNAAKFMGDEPAPRVEIGVEQVGEELVLFVRDNGIGIDPQLQPMLFGLFHKLDPGSEGTGIGLALVRRIVEVHGGRIWVESEGPGKGTTFRFTLAKTRRDRAEEAPLKLPGSAV